MLARACGWPAVLLCASISANVEAAPTVLVSDYELNDSTHEPKNQAFGYHVALSRDGGTLVVTDPWYVNGGEYPWYESGAVYVYAKVQRAWVLQAKLQPPEPLGYDQFGVDVSLSADGNVLAVGAQYEGGDTPEEGGDIGVGSVFVYTRTHGSWTQTGYLRSPNPQHGASFGRRVELSASGAVLAVAAPFESGVGNGSSEFETGSVYVFKQTPAGWSAPVGLQAPVPQRYDRFGIGLRLSESGRTLAVLAGEQNYSTEDYENGGWGGRVNTLYVFGRAAGEWQLQTVIEGGGEPFFAGDGDATDAESEGFDLSRDGSVLAVGTSGAAAADNEYGYVTLYERVEGVWSASSHAPLTPSLTQRSQFGRRLTLSPDGSTLAASVTTNEGAYGRPYVVVFRRDVSGWSQSDALTSPAWPAYSSFGNSISLSRTGRWLAIGSRGYSTQSSWWGAALLYQLSRAHSTTYAVPHSGEVKPIQWARGAAVEAAIR